MEYLVLFLPLLGAILGYLSKKLGDLVSQIVTTVFICITAILSIVIFYNGVFHDDYGNYLIYEWIGSGNFIVNWSVNIDPLSSIMILIVSLVSALVHIYSIGYMEHDPDKPRLFLIIFYNYILDGKA